MQKILLFAALLTMLAACGSKKKTTSRSRTEKVRTEQRDVKLIETENARATTYKDSSGTRKVVEPIDASKPMVYKGETSENARIIEETAKSTTKSEGSSERASNLEDKSKVREKEKTSGRTAEAVIKRQSPWVWIGLAIVAAVVLFLKLNPWRRFL